MTDGVLDINGGDPIKDCPTDWEWAKTWQKTANKDRDKHNHPTWKWDCGYKLDFDGPIVSFESRFYPPKTHYGVRWDGYLGINVMGRKIREVKFDCETLEELRAKVEEFTRKFSLELIEQLTSNEAPNDRE